MRKPESIVRIVDGVSLINPTEFLARLTEIPLPNRLMGALALAGAESYDDEGRYIAEPTVSVVAVNGVSFDTQRQTTDEVTAAMRTSADNARSLMELSAAFSYLNSGDMQAGDLYEKVVNLGHLSIGHAATINMIIAGTSVGVENEFNSQRDLVHLSRITVARTALQNRPPVVVSNESMYEPTRQAVEAIDAILEEADSDDAKDGVSRRDVLEGRNLLYPAAKANGFMISATLRNMMKLVAQKDDAGKEREYRTILDKIKDQAGAVWPELFS